MDFKMMKETIENIKMPEGMAEEMIQNCEKRTGKTSFFKRSHKFVYRIVAATIAVAVSTSAFFLWSPWETNSVYGNDLMEGVIPNQVETKEADEAWIQAVADFSVELFKNGQTTNENSLISPLSVYLALAMTANGANGETLEAFEQVLGNGMSIEDINIHAYSLLNRLLNENQETLKINNSIWFDKKNSGKVCPEFLQSNSDYYKSDAFQINFGNKRDALEKVNAWVSKATDGEIEQMLNDIESSTAFLLINTILFESKWGGYYEKPNKEPFQNANGEWVNVPMLEGIRKYIENENATGFINGYEDEQYSFVALLPKEGMSLEEYVNALTGEELLNMINLETEETCLSYLPEFDYEYNVDLAGSLKNMGLLSAFNTTSDFSNMAEAGEILGKLYISKVDHQTFIHLDADGTKAGAATVVHIPTRGEVLYTGLNYVFLNRPFFYAIIDNSTKIPVFLGTVNKLTGDEVEAPEYATYIEQIDNIEYLVNNSIVSTVSLVKVGEEVRKCSVNTAQTIAPLPRFISCVEAFAAAGNAALEEVEIYCSGNGTFTIREGAFSSCPNLKKVVFKSDWGVFATIAEDAFAGSDQVVFYLQEGHYTEEIQQYAQKHGIPVEFYDVSGEY